KIEVDVLIDEPGLIENLEGIRVPFGEGKPLIKREPEFAGNHVDRAGEEIGFERGRILDRADRDTPKTARRSHPVRVRLEQDVRSGDKFADTIGAVVEALLRWFGVVMRAQPILSRVEESISLDMHWQQHEVLNRRVVKRQFVEMQ